MGNIFDKCKGKEKEWTQPQPDPSKLPKVNIPPPESGKQYLDWSKSLAMTPQEVYAPTSLKELHRLLETNDHVSIVASGHSSSEIWRNGTVITLDEMQPREIRDVSTTGDFSRVEIPAWMTLREVLVLLGKQGRSLTATGGTDEQQIGGLIATNTAPATKERVIYESIEEIKYTTKEKPDNVANSTASLKALICNMGILGVVTSVTWKTIPDEGYRVIQRIKKVDELVELMAHGQNFVNNEDGDNTKEYAFWRFDWIPDRDFALLWAAREVNTVSDPNYLPNGDYTADYKEPFSMHIYEFIAKGTAPKSPFLDKAMSAIFDAMERVYELETKQNTFYGPLRNMLPVDRFSNENVYCAMAEWAFHPKQIKEVVDLYRKYFSEHEWPNLPIEIEYVKSDGYYMSPWNSDSIGEAIGEATEFLVKINTMWYIPSKAEGPGIRPQVENHAKGIWIVLKENNIPFKAHWGKINFTSPEDAIKLYDFDAFSPKIQQQFVNSYINTRLPNRK